MARAKRGRSKDRPNIVHRGQRATLNGKPVIADGKGNWLSRTPGTWGNAQYDGKKTGSYKPGEHRKPTKSKPTKTKPTYKGPGGNPNGSGQGQAQQAPPAPKLPPKPKAASKVTAPKSTAPKKTAPKKPAATSTKKLTPMQQWAKANPELAKKVKKGQSGHKELKIGRSTKPRNWLEKNYKPGKKK